MREKLYSELTSKDIWTIGDPPSIKFSNFDFSAGYYEHEVRKYETERPYLISYQWYGTVIYEDILLFLNGISDPFQLRTGVKLKIPRIDDLKTFLNEQKIAAV